MTNYIQEIRLSPDSIYISRKSEFDNAITDLLEENSFNHLSSNGPYNISISSADNKILFDINCSEDKQHNITISIIPLRKLIKDYQIVCENYLQAVKNSDIRRVEAIDMGRRGLHNEGADVIIDQSDKSLEVDFETARKLFTLIYLLHKRV